MNISRFFGSTSREAMRQVRIALGPDALIVSNRRVNGGVEILATDSVRYRTAIILPIIIGALKILNHSCANITAGAIGSVQVVNTATTIG